MPVKLLQNNSKVLKSSSQSLGIVIKNVKNSMTQMALLSNLDLAVPVFKKFVHFCLIISFSIYYCKITQPRKHENVSFFMVKRPNDESSKCNF